MKKVAVLVLRAAGINCDEEVVHGWRLASAEPTLMHVAKLAADPGILDGFQVVTIPGGFSYGDDIAAGTILAQRFIQELAEPLHRLVERGGGIFGICNGFQVMVKAGLLPGGDWGRGKVTVTSNDSARFEARWVRMVVCTQRCPFLPKDAGAATQLEMPVEHAEGKVIAADAGIIRKLEEAGQIALRYVDDQGRHDTYPANPNGSVGGIAGLCDPTGRVFGLMPHPDRHLDRTQHPQWTRRARSTCAIPDGLAVFQNAVAYWSGR